MHGVSMPMPSRYPAEVTLAEEYQWTYAQVHEAPADYIDELLTRIYARRKWDNERIKRENAKAKAKAAQSSGKKKR